MDKALLPYRRYFDFAGRSTRTEYFAFLIATSIVYVFLAVIYVGGMPRSSADQPSGMAVLALALIVVFWIGSLVPTFAVTVRRFHDQGRTGWMTLLGAIPYAGGLILLIFMCLSGDGGPNRFGEDPRDA
jgi:uncharacterized membrane protein YhaH (DUF805 family)